MPMTYIDMNKVLGKVNLAKGEKTTGQCFCGACTYEIYDGDKSGLCHC